jgi:hypothetical protein
MFDLLDQLPETLRRIHGTAVLVERGGETVDSYLHGGAALPRKRRRSWSIASGTSLHRCPYRVTKL